MFEIPIYKAERDAGIADAIRASASFAFASLAEPASELIEQIRAKCLEKGTGELAKAAAEANHVNLHPFKSLLVSVGWNKNDDVFDPKEVWAARATPEDNPINMEHDSTKIRGHITGQYPVNASMERLADDMTVDELPEKFHIVASGVLYKRYADKEVQAEMTNVIDELAEGKWFVSMECLLRDFDYAVIDAKGNHGVIPRCEQSSFLTKHLRAYGGEGKYEGYKVGRLLRAFSFSGKGLVRKPANPESVILAEASAFSGSRKEFSQFFSQSGYESSTAKDETERESLEMATELDLLKEQLTQVQAQLKTVSDERNLAQAALKEVETKQLTNLQNEVAAKATEVTTISAKLAEAEKSLTEVKATLTETQKTLETVQAENRLTKRISTLQSKLGVDEAKASEMATKMANLSDEAFVQAADYMAEKKAEFEKAANSPDMAKGSGVARTEKENEHGAGHPTAEGLETSKHSHEPKKPVKTLDQTAPAAKRESTNGNEPSTIETATETETAAASTNPAEAKVEKTEPSMAITADGVNEKVESTRASIAAFINHNRKTKSTK